jgi:hypothetical protein
MVLKSTLATLIKGRMLGAPPLRVGDDLSVYAHQGIRAQSIKEIYAMDFVAQPQMDISGYAWAILDDFLYAIELLAPNGELDLYLIFDACQNPRKKETSAQRREKTNQAALDLQKYIHSKEVYKESKLKELMCKCVYLDKWVVFHGSDRF